MINSLPMNSSRTCGPFSHVKLFSDLNFYTDCDDNVSRGIYHRISSLLNWIQGTTCVLTNNASGVPFPCPDVVCPPGELVSRWPTAPLNDGTKEAVAFGNFRGATTLSQSPPPKTRLPANSRTAVTITATNAVNETANGTWYVGNPHLEVLLNKKSTAIPAGEKKTVAKFQFSPSKKGYAVFASARLSEGRIPGRNSFIRLRIKASLYGSDIWYRPAILLTAKKPSVNATFTDVFSSFDDGRAYRVEVRVQHLPPPGRCS